MSGIGLADGLPVVTRLGGGSEHGAARRLPLQIVLDEVAHSPVTARRLGVEVGVTDTGIHIGPFLRHWAPDVDRSAHCGSSRLGRRLWIRLSSLHPSSAGERSDGAEVAVALSSIADVWRG